MVTTHVRAASSRARSSAHEPTPDECPEEYASTCIGDCLEPVFQDGVCLVFSKSEEAVPGDFVGVWIQGNDGTVERRVKKLAFALMPGIRFPFKLAPEGEIEPLVILEQLNPPRRYRLPATKVLALHKVIGEATPEGDGTARFRRKADVRF